MVGVSAADGCAFRAQRIVRIGRARPKAFLIYFNGYDFGLSSCDFIILAPIEVNPYPALRHTSDAHGRSE